MLDLDQTILIELKEILAKYVPDFLVYAHGSRVKGTSHAGSDLDLVLMHPEGKPVEVTQLQALREALSESNIPILIDVLDWEKIPESFRKEISPCKQLI